MVLHSRIMFKRVEMWIFLLEFSKKNLSIRFKIISGLFSLYDLPKVNFCEPFKGARAWMGSFIGWNHSVQFQVSRFFFVWSESCVRERGSLIFFAEVDSEFLETHRIWAKSANFLKVKNKNKCSTIFIHCDVEAKEKGKQNQLKSHIS